MIRSICCVCGYVYGTKEDGKPEVEVQAMLAELPGDRRAA